MSARPRVRVLLAGPYPAAGGMTGTYGRILDNLRTSPVFAREVEFVPFRVSLPGQGGLVRRLASDLARFAAALRRPPAVLHLVLQKYRALYRELPMVTMAGARGVTTVADVRAGTLQHMLARPRHRLQNAMMRRILRTADAVLLECAGDVDFVARQFGRDGLYLPNVVRSSDLDRLVPATPPRPGEPLRLVFSGRYTVEKGLHTILDALQVLAGRDRAVELHLTGQATDSALAERIRQAVDYPPAGIRIVDHGWDVGDLLALLARNHVFVMPTTWWGEGHPNAVTEAMAAGLAMIVSDWAHRGSIIPDQGALVVPPSDPAALADAVDALLADRDLVARAGAANRRRVEERFADTVCYPRLLKLYRGLAGAP